MAFTGRYQKLGLWTGHQRACKPSWTSQHNSFRGTKVLVALQFLSSNNIPAMWPLASIICMVPMSRQMSERRKHIHTGTQHQPFIIASGFRKVAHVNNVSHDAMMLCSRSCFAHTGGRCLALLQSVLPIYRALLQWLL